MRGMLILLVALVISMITISANASDTLPSNWNSCGQPTITVAAPGTPTTVSGPAGVGGRSYNYLWYVYTVGSDGTIGSTVAVLDSSGNPADNSGTGDSERSFTFMAPPEGNYIVALTVTDSATGIGTHCFDVVCAKMMVSKTCPTPCNGAVCENTPTPTTPGCPYHYAYDGPTNSATTVKWYINGYYYHTGYDVTIPWGAATDTLTADDVAQTTISIPAQNSYVVTYKVFINGVESGTACTVGTVERVLDPTASIS